METAPFRSRKAITGFDLIIIVLIVIICAGVLFWQRHKSPGITVQIFSDNQLVNELPLNKDAYYTVSIELGTNTIVIENGRAFVIDADCPDKLCEKQSAISLPGEMIICLPHKLIVEVHDGE